MSENSNNWTLLTPEVKESGVENVGPVAENLKVEVQISKAPEPSPEAHSDLEKHSSAHQAETDTSTQLQSDPALTHGSEPSEPSQVTSPETSEGRAQLNAANVDEGSSSVSANVDVSSWTTDHEKQGHPESPVIPSTDVDSFSDSYTHISPTSGSSPLPASVSQERDWFKSDEDSLRKTITEESKEALETNGKKGDGLRKRKISHLGSLDKTEAEDDEEGEEEDFQPPQREEETVFSLNKCILAAVILLGLGTIFFSEADMDVSELKDPTNQEWLNPEISKDTPVGLQPPDILSKQVKEDQQILVLQEQLQQHQGELKAAQLLAEEGEKERVRREELEKEYERMKGELDRVPVLQKELAQENERIKEESARAMKELEALPSLQRELEHLRAKVSQLTQSTGRAESVLPVGASQMPSTGDKSDVPPMERQEAQKDLKPRKTWDKKSEKEQSKGDKEGKKKKSGKKEDNKERKERVTEEKHKEQKDWKKDKSHQEEGKAGKQKEERKEWKKDKKQDYDKMDRACEGKKDFKDWNEKKEWKEDKKSKKDKHVGQDEKRRDKKDTGNKKVREGKEWKQRGERKEDKDGKSDKRNSGNDHKEWKEKRKDEWKGEKEWRKEKSEGKHNDKTEKKWKGDKEFPKEYDERDLEKKQWKKQREPKDKERSREGVKEEKKKNAPKNKGKNGPNEKEKQHKEKHGHGAPAETSSHHHYDHENYWSKQRERIQHYDGPRETCSGVTDCARAEGLSPVSLQDFQTLLQSYLKKLQDQDQTSRKEELSKLVKEFFTDGVFAHDQMPFREFVEDVGDILEDMAEGEDSDSEGEESEEDDDDDEMEEFEREAMEKFALPEEVKKIERKGEQKKESRKVKG